MPVTDDDLELWAAFAAKYTIHPPAGACTLTEVVAGVRRLRGERVGYEEALHAKDGLVAELRGENARLRAAARDAAAALARSPSSLAQEAAGRLREALREP